MQSAKCKTSDLYCRGGVPYLPGNRLPCLKGAGKPKVCLKDCFCNSRRHSVMFLAVHNSCRPYTSTSSTASGPPSPPAGECFWKGNFPLSIFNSKSVCGGALLREGSKYSQKRPDIPQPHPPSEQIESGFRVQCPQAGHISEQCLWFYENVCICNILICIYTFLTLALCFVVQTT